MREIKFRAWDLINEEMVVNSELETSELMDVFCLEDLEVMQYTGLKDENGVEIYEGDIVVVAEPDEDSCMGREFEYKGVVSYGNTLGVSHYTPEYPTSFCLISKTFHKEQSLLWDKRWTYEVIGNIYENPELLEERK